MRMNHKSSHKLQVYSLLCLRNIAAIEIELSTPNLSCDKFQLFIKRALGIPVSYIHADPLLGFTRDHYILNKRKVLYVD